MNELQKGSALTGAALTDETLASSDAVLQKGMYGVGQKGLQQFYSPPQAATLVANVMNRTMPILDPTAGDGSLIAEWDFARSFGIEIDKDQIKNAQEAGRGYNAIKGDLQHVYTLLYTGMASWPQIAANPPFGLRWSDPTYRSGKQTNSAELTFAYIQRLLSDDGQYVFIDGKNHFYKRIAAMDGAEGIYAVIECDDMFEGTAHPCVIAFGINPGIRSAESMGYVQRTFTLDTLDLAGQWVTDARTNALGRYNRVASSHWYSHDLPKQFETIQKEYNRRLEGRIKQNREFDGLIRADGRLQWLPQAYATMALEKLGDRHAFHGLNGQPLNYFTNNERLWIKMTGYAEAGIVTLEPRLVTAVENLLGAIRKERIPLYHVKRTQRLGFLDDIEFLKCVVDDPERGFNAGEMYRIHTQTLTVVEREKRIVESKKNPGEYVEKEFEKQKKVLKITIGHHFIQDGGEKASDDIRWMLKHFELPDPGDVSTKHPKEIAALEALVREVMEEMQTHSRVWEEKNPTVQPFTVRDFQVKDIARMLFKQTGLLSWEQGLGKTAGGIAFYLASTKLTGKAKAQEACLVVTANDLIDQWKREFKRFTGREPRLIKTHGQARDIARHVKHGGQGLYIAHYGTLSLAGTKGKNLLLPPVVVKEWKEPRRIRNTGKYGLYQCIDPTGAVRTLEELLQAGEDYITEKYGEDDYRASSNHSKMTYAVRNTEWKAMPTDDAHADKVQRGHIPEQFEQVTKKLTSKDLCPSCQADTRSGWNGAYCEAKLANDTTCGYSHYAVKVKPITSQLSTAFRNGVGIYDEIQMIQARASGNDSKRSRALRGPKFKYFLGLTGTPIKNYIDQAFWPLWKSLGNETMRFPYGYEAGPTRFENDFSVIEYVKNGGRREQRKALPEVTNLSTLWRLLSSSIIRRRKEETGEKLVPKFYHEIRVKMGVAQAEQYASWLKNFPDFFKEKFPDHPIVKAGMHTILAPTLGMNWKLDYACTLPLGDPDAEWTGVEGLSNFTPANVKVLELAMALTKQGRKVLIGSNLKQTSGWIAEQLCAKEVKAVHILDEDGNTVDADTRAKHVYAFQTDEIEVFCAGTKAIRLGHNLDAASAVILSGLDFDYETLEQFVARIHRLTSTNPVDIFVILPTLEEQQTITTRKWDLLEMKGGAAELALDGRLILKNEQRISESEMIRDLMERGFRVTEDALDETTMQEIWEDTPMIGDFEILDGMIPDRPELPVDPDPVMTPHSFHVAKTVGDFLARGYNAIMEAQAGAEIEEAEDDEELEELLEVAAEYGIDLVRDADECVDVWMCDNCGSEIPEEEYNRTGTDDFCESCPEITEDPRTCSDRGYGTLESIGQEKALAELKAGIVSEAEYESAFGELPDGWEDDLDDEDPADELDIVTDATMFAEESSDEPGGVMAPQEEPVEAAALAVDTGVPAAVEPPASPAPTLASEIREMKALLDEGIIDAEEFAQWKKEALAGRGR